MLLWIFYRNIVFLLQRMSKLAFRFNFPGTDKDLLKIYRFIDYNPHLIILHQILSALILFYFIHIPYRMTLLQAFLFMLVFYNNNMLWKINIYIYNQSILLLTVRNYFRFSVYSWDQTQTYIGIIFSNIFDNKLKHSFIYMLKYISEKMNYALDKMNQFI